MLSDLTWYENILVIPPLVALGIGTLAFVTSGVVIFKVSGPLLRQHADLLLTGTQDLSLQSPKDYLRTYWPLLSYELLVLIPLLMYTIAFEVRGMVVGGHTHTPVMFDGIGKRSAFGKPGIRFQEREQCGPLGGVTIKHAFEKIAHRR